MPYDSELDQKLFYETKEFENTRVTVGVFSYNNGEKKLQLSRENISPTGEWRFAKLGRVNKSEIEAILPLIQSAIGKM
jgi:hypothetical protein